MLYDTRRPDRTAHSTAWWYGQDPLPFMGGAGSSVHTFNNANPLDVKKDDDDDDVVLRDNFSASKFDVFADLLASNYHNDHCRGVGNPLGEAPTTTTTTPVIGAVSLTAASAIKRGLAPVVGAVSPTASAIRKGLARIVVPPSLRSKPLPPPLPRAERKKLSREQQQQQLRYAVDGGGEEDISSKRGREESIQVSAGAAAVASLDKG